MATTTMMRCTSCDKPVMLLTPEQAERVAAEPERYDFMCTGCTEPPC